MADLRFSHIGWAVSSIEKSVSIFSVLGFVPHGSACKDVKRGVRILLLKNVEGNKIELVEPLDNNSPVSNLLKKTGPSPYHICLSCSQKDYIDFKKLFIDNKFIEIHKIEEAPALGGDEVAFFYSNIIGLIEIQLKSQV